MVSLQWRSPTHAHTLGSLAKMDNDKPLKFNPNLQPIGANAIACCNDISKQIQNNENAMFKIISI